MDLRTAHALVRFGLGSNGTETPPANPSAWLLDQLRHPDQFTDQSLGQPPDHPFGPPVVQYPGQFRDQSFAPSSLPPLPATAEGLAAIRADREDKPPPGQSRARALYQTQGLAAVAHAV